jgi:hypothetical protein
LDIIYKEKKTKMFKWDDEDEEEYVPLQSDAKPQVVE